MTREEFLEIGDFGDLITFCNENHICADLIEDVYDDDLQNELIVQDINECIGYGMGWKGLKEYLYGIPSEEYWHRRNGFMNWDDLDGNDFEDYKQEVLEAADKARLFDEDDVDLPDDSDLIALFA